MYPNLPSDLVKIMDKSLLNSSSLADKSRCTVRHIDNFSPIQIIFAIFHSLYAFPVGFAVF